MPDDNSTTTTADGSVITGVEPPARVSLTPPPSQPAATHPADEVFSKADLQAAIEQAREQEKNKLYGRMQGLEERLGILTSEREERLKVEEEARAAAEEAARRQEEEQLSLRELLERRNTEWEDRLAQIQAEREQERALFAKEREFQEIERYREQATAAASEDILPELLDDVRGNTPEEIDASIARLRDKTASILGNVEQIAAATRQQQPGVRPTLPPAGPLDNESGQKQYTDADIRSMSMDEYREFRQKTGIGSAGSSRGLFG